MVQTRMGSNRDGRDACETGTLPLIKQLPTLARREGKCTRSVFAGSVARGGTVVPRQGAQHAAVLAFLPQPV